MSKFRKICVASLIVSITAVLFVQAYWITTCSEKACDYYTVTGLLDPLEYAGYFLTVFFLIFLFLPVHYFESWLKRVFSWAFPLSFILVLGTGNSGSVMSVSRAEVVILTGVFFGVITLVFVLLRWWKLKKAGVPK